MESPVFVKIEQYKELTRILDEVNKKIAESEKMLHQLEELKAEEDAQLQSWSSSLEGVKSKTEELKKALFSK